MLAGVRTMELTCRLFLLQFGPDLFRTHDVRLIQAFLTARATSPSPNV